MKKYLVLLCFLLLTGCSADKRASEVPPPEKDFHFESDLVDVVPVPNEYVLKNEGNELSIQLVTTYEQAAFLRRNTAYIKVETVEGDFEFAHSSIQLGNRIELDHQVYYSMVVILKGPYSEWVNIPKNFSTLVFSLEEQVLMEKDIGQVQIVETYSVEPNEATPETMLDYAKRLHERLK